MDCDLCIIGSEYAGISLASKFTESDQTIIILESGDVNLSPRHTSLNDGISIGEREVNTSESRARRYGGGMHLWAGTSAPFQNMNLLVDLISIWKAGQSTGITFRNITKQHCYLE